MKLPGISDSPAHLLARTPVCEVCSAAARVEGGLCLKCLLQVGADTSLPRDEASFEAVLAEIDLPDTNWRFGNYQILQEIGRGGMGVIYRARQRHSGRVVALKCVLGHAGASSETLDRFRREAQAAASLDHPNILPIYEIGTANGLPFFTMKYATGGSLQQAKHALISDRAEAVRLMAKVARAVAHAHSRGILHRDLKPANILLDARQEPMVSDFGLAKWLGCASDLTRSMALFGTPGFIAPEQGLGERTTLTYAADIYSLGAILYDLQAGRPPFVGDNALAVIRQAANKPAPKLRTLAASVDRDLEMICAKCLDRDPAVRYRSAHELADDLDRWLADKPVRARPVSVTLRLWRSAKRNPLVTAAAVACLLLSGVAISRQMRSSALTNAVERQVAAHHSVEVLPVFDLDTARPDAPFTATLAAELKNELDRFGPAEVRLKNSGNPAARTVLKGTKRLHNGNLRVALRVEKAETGEKVLHARETIAPSASPGEAVNRIAETLYRRLDSPDLTHWSLEKADPGLKNEEARAFLDSGRRLMDARSGPDLQKAIAAFERALALEPRSSMAHSRLADGLVRRIAHGEGEESLTQVKRLAIRALELEPMNTDAHRVHAAALYLEGRLPEAIEELNLAFETGDLAQGPNLMASAHRSLGRPDRALVWSRLAFDRTGRSLGGYGDAWSDLAADAEAEKAYRRYAELRPDHPDGWMGLCRLNLLQGNFDEARAIAAANVERYRSFSFTAQMAAQVQFFTRDFPEAERLYATLASKDPNGGGQFYGAVSYQSALGRLRLARNDEAGARAILLAAREREMQSTQFAAKHPEALYRLAAIAASLGETETALDQLHAAAKAGWIDYRSLAIDPRFDAIRDREQFENIIAELTVRVADLREQALAAATQ